MSFKISNTYNQLVSPSKNDFKKAKVIDNLLEDAK
jgi:hypothetical protein